MTRRKSWEPVYPMPPNLLQRGMSVIGTKRHFAALQQTVAFGGKANIRLNIAGGANLDLLRG